MTRKDVEKCSKCGGSISKGKRLICFTEVSLADEGEHVGDEIIASYCRNCGYIELYKEKKDPKESFCS